MWEKGTGTNLVSPSHDILWSQAGGLEEALDRSIVVSLILKQINLVFSGHEYTKKKKKC